MVTLVVHRTTFTDIEVAFISKFRVARLATADEHGRPYLVPVCYAFDGMYFFIALDEKPKRVAKTQLRRVQNIEARHEASLLIDQYDDDWSQLGYILISCKAELIAPEHERHKAAVVLLRERYEQYQTMALEQYPVIMLTPDRITSWGSVLHP
ncbi:MAG: TIGR03668 family PPOX class F420-dependent oxidoreductase [Ktedonobacteraceae bacterium]